MKLQARVSKNSICLCESQHQEDASVAILCFSCMKMQTGRCSVTFWPHGLQNMAYKIWPTPSVSQRAIVTKLFAIASTTDDLLSIAEPSQKSVTVAGSNE